MAESFSTSLTSNVYNTMVWESVGPTVMFISFIVLVLSYEFMFDKKNI